MKPAPFDYMAAKTVAEAVAALARGGDDAKVLAGGQSLVPMLNMRLARPTLLVDVNDITELEYVRTDGALLTVGALVRQAALARWAAERSPLLAEVFRWIGHAAIRNRGTVAGSIVHADPAAELPAVLLACDGAVVARSPRGERTIAGRELYLAPLTTSLAADELVTEVRLALPSPTTGWGFAEVARRHGDFALAGALAVLTPDGSGRVAHAALALFGVGGVPVRATEAEALLVGKEPMAATLDAAARAAAARLDPHDDLHASATYRREVAEVLSRRTLADAVGRWRRAA